MGWRERLWRWLTGPRHETVQVGHLVLPAGSAHVLWYHPDRIESEQLMRLYQWSHDHGIDMIFVPYWPPREMGPMVVWSFVGAKASAVMLDEEPEGE